MAESPRVSIILPTFNEREALGKLYPSLAEAVRGLSAEIVIVDDDSPDGTGPFARTLTSSTPTRVLVRPGERGLASAVLDGIAHSTGAVVVVMDADGSHPPELVAPLVRAVEEGGAEFALGSRWVPGGTAPEFTPWRRFLSSGASLLARPLVSVKDPMSGFFAVRRSILGRAHLAPVGYKIALEIIVKCDPRPLVELPIDFRPRLAGESKLHGGEVGRYFVHVLRLYGWRLFGSRRASSTR